MSAVAFIWNANLGILFGLRKFLLNKSQKFVSKITDWAVNGTNAVKIEWNGKDIII